MYNLLQGVFYYEKHLHEVKNDYLPLYLVKFNYKSQGVKNSCDRERWLKSGVFYEYNIKTPVSGIFPKAQTELPA